MAGRGTGEQTAGLASGHLFRVVRIVPQAVFALPKGLGPAIFSAGLTGSALASQHGQPSPPFTTFPFFLAEVVNSGE